MTSQSMTSHPSFHFPREYSFPPFFTRQPNLTTHHAQLTKWSSLVLSYCRHHRIHRLTIDSGTPSSDLFHNRSIDRRLSPSDIRDVLDHMRRDGRAELLSSDPHALVALIYWRTPEEWAASIESYIDDTAQRGSVLTLYELISGDNTKSADFHGIDRDLLLKALNVLVKRGKAQIFGSQDSLGVKFF